MGISMVGIDSNRRQMFSGSVSDIRCFSSKKNLGGPALGPDYLQLTDKMSGSEVGQKIL